MTSRTSLSQLATARGAPSAALAACILASCFLAGCASPGGETADRLLIEEARRRHAEAERAWEAAAPAQRAQPTASRQPDGRRDGRRDGRPTRAIRFNRTLLYAPQWLRSEDLEQTLAPLVQNLYGPGAQVISQTGSNRIGIYIPPREAREAGGAAAGLDRRAGVPSPRSPTRR